MTEQQTLWSINETIPIKSYTLTNFRTIPEIERMSELYQSVSSYLSSNQNFL